MSITHKTASGTVTLIGREWRDGEFPQTTAGVARLTVHDDVTNAVWRFTGNKLDAARALGALYVAMRDKVAVLNGNSIEIESASAYPLIGVGEPNEDGEFDDFEFDFNSYPEVVAF